MRYDGNHFDSSSHCSPSHVESSSFPLDLAGDSRLAKALRNREDIFNDDVLPRDAELRAPIDFYAAMVSCSRTHGQKRTADGRAAMRFPYLAA